MIDTVRRGVFVNLLKEEFGEEEKIQIAAALFPEGYVTGYEALRYWSMMRAEYEGLCLRVDWTIHSAVPQVVSKPVVWKGYRFKSFQMSPTLSFGIEKPRMAGWQNRKKPYSICFTWVESQTTLKWGCFSKSS